MKRRTAAVWGKRVLVMLILGAEAGTAGWLLWHYASQGTASQIVAERVDEPKMEQGQKQAGMKRKKHELQTDADEETERIPEEGEAVTGQEKEMDGWIRVRILGDDYKTDWHEAVEVTSKSCFTVEIQREKEEAECREFPEGSVFTVDKEEVSEGEVWAFVPEPGGTLILPLLRRAQAEPEYGGRLYLYREEEGLVLVNELLLEEYLCSVVASEMPSDYPKEALKAQAVCARTYARNCREQEKNSSGYADLDDSVSFQVYNNYRASTASRAAVRETSGEYLDLEEVLYYSTACGLQDCTGLENDESLRICLEKAPEEGLEYDSPWVRWSVSLTEEELQENLRRDGYTVSGAIDRIAVTKRSPNGQAQELTVSSRAEMTVVSGEYEIRRILAPRKSELCLWDGTVKNGMGMLPSAWVCILPEKSTASVFALLGGGYGHGRGMSQCGAAALAQGGAGYREILEYYYRESELQNVQDF